MLDISQGCSLFHLPFRRLLISSDAVFSAAARKKQSLEAGAPAGHLMLLSRPAGISDGPANNAQ